MLSLSEFLAWSPPVKLTPQDVEKLLAAQSCHPNPMVMVPWLIDFGYLPQACELCENTLRGASSHETAHAEMGFARLILAHASAASHKSIDEARLAFTRPWQGELAGSSWGLFLQAHADSGLGLLALFDKKISVSMQLFQQSRRMFKQTGAHCEALKTAIREVMALRMDCRYADADALCKDIAAEARLVGGRAVISRLFAETALGSNALEQGRRHEGLRLLRDAAKTARLLPACAAAASAYFHYGHALEQTGRQSMALPWLQMAEELQRVRDPIARAATLVVLLRCLIQQKQWQQALRLVRGALTFKAISVGEDVHWEWFSTSIQLAGLVADEGLLARIQAHLTASEASAHRERLLFEVDKARQELDHARVEIASISPLGERVVLRFNEGLFLKADSRGEVHPFSLRRDSAQWAFLQLLAQRAQGSHPEAVEADLLSTLKPHATGRKAASERRMLLRALQELRSHRLISRNRDAWRLTPSPALFVS